MICCPLCFVNAGTFDRVKVIFDSDIIAASLISLPTASFFGMKTRANPSPMPLAEMGVVFTSASYCETICPASPTVGLVVLSSVYRDSCRRVVIPFHFEASPKECLNC